MNRCNTNNKNPTKTNGMKHVHPSFKKKKNAPEMTSSKVLDCYQPALKALEKLLTGWI